MREILGIFKGAKNKITFIYNKQRHYNKAKHLKHHVHIRIIIINFKIGLIPFTFSRLDVKQNNFILKMYICKDLIN